MQIMSLKNPKTNEILYFEGTSKSLISTIIQQEISQGKLTDTAVTQRIQKDDPTIKELKKDAKCKYITSLNKEKVQNIQHQDIVEYRNGEKWTVKQGQSGWMIIEEETMEMDFFDNLSSLKEKLIHVHAEKDVVEIKHILTRQKNDIA